MKFLTQLSLAALVSLASSASIQLNKRDSPLDVKLEMIGNSEVKATVKNVGASELKLYKTGTILDDSPIEKVEIYSPESRVNFEGVKLRVATTDLAEEDFQSLAAGESIEVTFDVAEMHDLTQGGAFDILSEGAIPYADAGSLDIANAAVYASNKIQTTVDGEAAKAVREAFTSKIKRAAVQSDCTGTRRTATTTALSNCRSLAAQASQVAASGSAAKVTEYFKSSSSSVRSQVAGVFSRVASECSSTTGGVSDYYCSDVYGACGSRVLAYTVPSLSIMVNCPLYFTGLSALSSTCHAQDQATTTLHEATHLSQIAGTDDFGVYGYSAVQQLSASQNLRHADTYTLFAQSIYAGC